MGEEEEIESRDRIAQELQAKVRCRVDEEVLPVLLDLHRLPQALVLRYARGADAATAADDRHARGSAGAEEGDEHGRGIVVGWRLLVGGCWSGTINPISSQQLS